MVGYNYVKFPWKSILRINSWTVLTELYYKPTFLLTQPPQVPSCKFVNCERNKTSTQFCFCMHKIESINVWYNNSLTTYSIYSTTHKIHGIFELSRVYHWRLLQVLSFLFILIFVISIVWKCFDLYVYPTGHKIKLVFNILCLLR